MVRIVQLFFLLVAVLVIGVLAESPPLILKHADFNENTMAGGKLRTFLKGNVAFEYDSSIIHSSTAVWYRSDGKATFSGNVVMDRGTQKLICNRLDVNRDDKVAIAEGAVDYYDVKEQVRINAEKVTYGLESHNMTIERKPVLFQYDSTAGDTLIIRSKRMTYSDSLKLATAIDDVSIIKGKLKTNSKMAYYETVSGRARLRTVPSMYYDVQELLGDSIDIFFVNQSVRGVSVKGKARGLNRDAEGSSRDTLLTRVNGDSLYMSIGTDGRFDTIRVFGNAKSRYNRLSDSLNTNEATGKNMVLSFTPSGDAERLIISGNARSTYFVDKKDSKDKGRNEASGDCIDVLFRHGRAAYLRLTGAVRGSYFGDGQN
jgi:lipopolysaccharide export system protein LptA